MHAEVFGKKEFQDWAKKNVVLLLVDFPAKRKQSDAVKEQNDVLAKVFEFESFPTTILMTARGKELARWSSEPPGMTPAAFIKAVEPTVKKATKGKKAKK